MMLSLAAVSSAPGKDMEGGSGYRRFCRRQTVSVARQNSMTYEARHAHNACVYSTGLQLPRLRWASTLSAGFQRR